MPPPRRSASLANSDSLADILERVLETGIVIAGDIRVNLNDVELLTIQIRLIVCSVDKAREMGMDWWRHAEYLTAGHGRRLRNAPDDTSEESTAASEKSTPDATSARLQQLDERLERLEAHMARLGQALDATAPAAPKDGPESPADDDVE